MRGHLGWADLQLDDPRKLTKLQWTWTCLENEYLNQVAWMQHLLSCVAWLREPDRSAYWDRAVRLCNAVASRLLPWLDVKSDAGTVEGSVRALAQLWSGIFGMSASPAVLRRVIDAVRFLNRQGGSARDLAPTS